MSESEKNYKRFNLRAPTINSGARSKKKSKFLPPRIFLNRQFLVPEIRPANLQVEKEKEERGREIILE